MARLFNDALNQYLQNGAAPLSGIPLSLVTWFNSDDATILGAIMQIGDASAQSRFSLDAAGTVGGDPILASAVEPVGPTFGTATSTAGFTANTWHHAAGVFTNATSRAAFIDGGNKGTDVTNVTPTNLDNVTIGAQGHSGGVFSHFSGSIAEAAIYNIALSDAEVALLAKGFSPLFIRPEALVAYWPLIRAADLDWMADFNMTAFNGPTVSPHPQEIVHPIPTTTAPPSLITLRPTEVFGQSIVENVFFLDTTHGLGTAFATAVKLIVITPDQRPTLATPGLAEYKVRLKNQDGEYVAEFDNWLSLSFTHKVNNRGQI
jgi:hypothetical protein